MSHDSSESEPSVGVEREDRGARRARSPPVELRLYINTGMKFRRTQLSGQLAILPTMPQQAALGGLLCAMSHCAQKEEVANDGQFVPFTHAISNPRVAG